MIKTVTLTGSEVKVTDLGGQNAAVKNLGSGSIYVSTKPNITAGADNVIEIPAGAGEVVLDANGTVYIVGTGKVQCTGTPYAVPNFKLPSSSSGGGGGTSDVTKEYVDAQDTTNLNLAKAYTDNAKSEIQTTIDTVNDTLNTHIADQVKHITAEERTAWDAKADLSDIPTELPANGGNADTVNGHTVESDVPTNAKFTDTTYKTVSQTEDGLMSAADKEKLDGTYSTLNTHIADQVKHITAEERTAWNAKADTDTATTTADGLMSAADKEKLDGIYSTLNTHIADQVKHITAEERTAWNAVNYSNPNLLINPDFRINQRGLTEYTGTALYTVDRWRKGFQYKPTSGDVVVTTSESGSITITNHADKSVTFAQKVENSRVLYGKTVTASARIDGVTYMATGTVLTTGKGTILRNESSSKFDFTVYQDCSIERFDFEIHIVSGVTVTIDWAKLELGSIATPFCPPDLATELAKCQRYYQIRSTNDIDPVDLRPSMRATPTDIKKVTGGYAYVAEL